MKSDEKTFSFRIAKDGLPYDIDDIAGELSENEVEVIQFLRPDGKRRLMVAPVGKESAKKAKNFILSAEVLRNGVIVLYARRIGEPEEAEKSKLAKKGPGHDSPTDALKRLIQEMEK